MERKKEEPNWGKLLPPALMYVVWLMVTFSQFGHTGTVIGLVWVVTGIVGFMLVLAIRDMDRYIWRDFYDALVVMFIGPFGLMGILIWRIPDTLKANRSAAR